MFYVIHYLNSHYLNKCVFTYIWGSECVIKLSIQPVYCCLKIHKNHIYCILMYYRAYCILVFFNCAFFLYFHIKRNIGTEKRIRFQILLWFFSTLDPKWTNILSAQNRERSGGIRCLGSFQFNFSSMPISNWLLRNFKLQ